MINQTFRSSGFSVARQEMTTLTQPIYTEYFVSTGAEDNIVLKRQPDLTLNDIKLITIEANSQLYPLDNITGDTSFPNGGWFCYDPATSYVKYPSESFTDTGNGSTFTFTFSITNPLSGRQVDVSVGGTPVPSSNYSITDNTTNIAVTFNTAPVGSIQVDVLASPVTSTPHGRLIIDSNYIPVAGTTLTVGYYINTNDYSEYSDGFLRQLAQDLCLHPYANDFTTQWRNRSALYNSEITLSSIGTIGGQATISITNGTGVFDSDDVGKRVRETDGYGTIGIDSISADGTTAYGTVETLFSDSGVTDDIYPSGKWLLVIGSDEVEPMPYNILYPWPEGASAPLTIDSNGQQNHYDVLQVIRSIGGTFVVESEKGTDLLSSKSDIIVPEESLPKSLDIPQAIKERRAPQKWRIRFHYDSGTHYLSVNVGTPYQIGDNSEVTRKEGRDGIKAAPIRMPGELSEVYTSPFVRNSKASSSFFRRQGKVSGNVANSYPISYRLTCSDHGTALFMWDHASVDQDDDYAWFVVQRHVNNTSGRIEFEEGKSPVHCIYSPSKRPVEVAELNSGYYLGYSLDTTSNPSQTTIVADNLDKIYNISGAELSPDAPVKFEFVTDTQRIAPLTTGTFIGGRHYLQYANATPPTFPLNGGTRLEQTAAVTLGQPAFAKYGIATVTDVMPIEFDQNGTNPIGTPTGGFTNMNAAMTNKIGPAHAGLMVEKVQICEDPTVDPTLVDLLPEDYEVVNNGLGVGSAEFALIFDWNNTNRKAIGNNGTGTNGQTTGTLSDSKGPEIVVHYRWNGAGYNGMYLNPYGDSLTRSDSVLDVTKLDVFLGGAEQKVAEYGEDYIIKPNGDIEFKRLPDSSGYQGTDINSYVYSIGPDKIFFREQVPDGKIVTLAYVNYSPSSGGNEAMYFIEEPEDKEIPASWKDLHGESKGIYRFVVRESDVLKPWDYHVSAVMPGIDSPAIINPMEQLSLTENKTFVFNFPSPMTTQRYIYPSSECDMICCSSADASTQGSPTYVGTPTSPKYDLDLGQDSLYTTDNPSVSSNGDILDFRRPYTWHTGVDSDTTSDHRTYLGMQSTKPYGNGMRVFVLVRGGPINPKYSDVMQ